MRFFTRSIGQKLRIGDDVVLTITSVRGGSVRLGFTVPSDMVVDREEIADFKKRQRVAGNLQFAAPPSATKSKSGKSRTGRPAASKPRKRT